jgi:hypothetical protein
VIRLALCATLAGCGGAQVAATVDVRALLRDGRPDEAIRELDRRAAEAPDDPEAARLLLLAHAAAWAKATPPGERPAPDPERERKALDALGRAARIERAGGAIRGVVRELPAVGLLQTRTGHVALTSLLLAYVTEVWAPRAGADDAARADLVQVGIGFLELVAAASEEGIRDEDAVRGPFDAASGMLDSASNGLRFGEDARSAWAVYAASARAAAALSRGSPAPPAARDALVVAVVVAERNPGLALAITCDLSSPIADLRRVAARDLEVIRRLEAAIAPAHGCAPGTYAP